MVVEYNSSAEFHLSKIRDAELARSASRRRGGAAAHRAQTTNASTPGPGEDAEAPSSPPAAAGAPEASPRPPEKPIEEDRPASPASSTSSDSEPPLAQRVTRVNGSSSVPPPAPMSSGSGSATAAPSQPPASSQSVPPSVGASAPTSGTAPSTDPPSWLWDATVAMRSKYPDDLFVLKRINGVDWRIKCSDCPGKVRARLFNEL